MFPAGSDITSADDLREVSQFEPATASTSAPTPEELNGTCPIFRVSPQNDHVLVAPTFEWLGMNNPRFLFGYLQIPGASPIIAKSATNMDTSDLEVQGSPSQSDMMAASVTATSTQLDGTDPIFQVSPQILIPLSPSTGQRPYISVRSDHLQQPQQHKALSSALVDHARQRLDATRLSSSLERYLMTDSITETYSSSSNTTIVAEPSTTIGHTRIASIEADKTSSTNTPTRLPTSPFFRWTQDTPDPVPVRNLPAIIVSPPREETRAAFLETDDISYETATVPQPRLRLSKEVSTKQAIPDSRSLEDATYH
ncbi:hypothetical protein SLS60_009538 [Paraconiothyrium brasiliense]|uniref:Uncharacterized protein n=1 Tax=Paraconiothyrium brasiliense TaxID=300254 RepID=A0ABR3QV17_9PLEO